MQTCWRNPITNKGSLVGTYAKLVIRRDGLAYKWSLMVHEEQIATGRAKTHKACREAARDHRAAIAGKERPAPPPIAPICSAVRPEPLQKPN